MNFKVVIASAVWGSLAILFWALVLPYPSRKCVIWCGVVVLALLIGWGILWVLAKRKIKKEKEKFGAELLKRREEESQISHS
ncbi:unnamed protein product, partial [marine sediment metagenome]